MDVVVRLLQADSSEGGVEEPVDGSGRGGGEGSWSGTLLRDVRSEG